ncbi:iron complex transport system ATP-binding protein [Paucimonas lemoignei]|uniref:Iron complex transport system ATP-binding protein n=1 Tax=Paucimonas lemoignei TaxID=29443 RepID=A0A4V2UI77_PAULE|nr:ABC transporter ATP-binding protein [Paucimonas lemoignei]TCS33999.1 iron complex transport system ATP-binding protein [Paucimonas lemoignei]
MSITGIELSTENLALAPDGHRLVDCLNWQVKRGEFWCILGQNGVGKSSLLYALGGLLPLESGRVLLDGVPLAEWPAQELALKHGLMPQQQVDHCSCKVLATVLSGRFPDPDVIGSGNSVNHAVAHAALASVGLTHKADMDVSTLSAGERQRVALATLLVQDPALMLLDEPVAHQDASQQLAMMRFIRELASKHTVISACHDIDLAARFATHVLVLAEGRHWLGTADDVLTVDILQQAFDCRFELKVSGSARSFIPY